MASLWCERVPPSPAALLSAVGVFSTPSRLEMRRAIRGSWLPGVPADAAVRFVLRGGDLDATQLYHLDAEARAWRDLQGIDDILLVNASAGLPRSIGPLATFVRWVRCAPKLFPLARFIGKFDDDVWINMPAMSAVLRMVARTIDRNATVEQEAIIGRMESYHWFSGIGPDGARDGNEGPTGWGAHACYGPCAQYSEVGWSGSIVGRNMSFQGITTGAFTFPKGQAFYLTRGLAHTISSSPLLQDHVDTLLRTNDERCFMTGVAWSKTVEQTKEEERARRRAAYALKRGLKPKSALIQSNSSVGGKRLPCEGKRAVQPPWEDVWLGLIAARLPMSGTAMLNTSVQAKGEGEHTVDDSSSASNAPGQLASLATPITFVSLHDPQVIDAHGLYAAESTISWHCRMHHDFVARAFTLEKWRAVTRRGGNGQSSTSRFFMNSSFGDGGSKLPVCRYGDVDVAGQSAGVVTETDTDTLRARLWCATPRRNATSCGGVVHRYCSIRTPQNCSGAYTNLWPVRTLVSCPSSNSSGNPWTFRGRCKMENKSAAGGISGHQYLGGNSLAAAEREIAQYALQVPLHRLDEERLEAMTALATYTDRVVQAERRNAETAARTGISLHLLERQNRVPPKKRTLMDDEQVGMRLTMDAQVGRIVA